MLRSPSYIFFMLHIMDFSKRLLYETKLEHSYIDAHPFTQLIKTNKDAGNLYINFNKICIYQTQKHINHLYSNTDLQHLLYIHFALPEFYISQHLSDLIIRCNKYPLEHEYMFKLGLISGGNILKKYIDSKHHEFLTFNDSSYLLVQFKTFLNQNIIEETQQLQFIQNVQQSYKLIQLCFNDFYAKLSTKNQFIIN
jgi:hypothetical protein